MNSGEIKRYTKNLEILKKALNYCNDLRRHFSQENIKAITEAAAIVEKQIDRVIDNGKVEPTDHERSVIKVVADLLLSAAVNQSVTPILRDMVISYAELISCWNYNIAHQDDIENMIKAAFRIITAQMTMQDTILVAKGITERLKQLNNYNPPAFEASKAYLITLDKRIKERAK